MKRKGWTVRPLNLVRLLAPFALLSAHPDQDVSSVLDAASESSLCYLLYWQQLNDHRLVLPIPDIFCRHCNA